MDQKVQQSKVFESRLIQLSVRVINTAPSLRVPEAVKTQIIRSATSVGANYAEALNASSKTDFRNKIYIAKKEAAETKYWLNVIGEVDTRADLEELKDDCQGILMVLQKTVNTINAQRKSKDQ